MTIKEKIQKGERLNKDDILMLSKALLAGKINKTMYSYVLNQNELNIKNRGQTSINLTKNNAEKTITKRENL